MIAAVSLTRLDRVKVKGQSGQRTYHVFDLTAADMLAIRLEVKAALALP
jgi:hypothetical protein